jgi:hypothetical protein
MTARAAAPAIAVAFLVALGAQAARDSGGASAVAGTPVSAPQSRVDVALSAPPPRFAAGSVPALRRRRRSRSRSPAPSRRRPARDDGRRGPAAERSDRAGPPDVRSRARRGAAGARGAALHAAAGRPAGARGPEARAGGARAEAAAPTAPSGSFDDSGSGDFDSSGSP